MRPRGLESLTGGPVQNTYKVFLKKVKNSMNNKNNEN